MGESIPHFWVWILWSGTTVNERINSYAPKKKTAKSCPLQFFKFKYYFFFKIKAPINETTIPIGKISIKVSKIIINGLLYHTFI